MWWNPRDEHEGQLASDIKAMRSWYRNQRSEEKDFSWGIGSTWSPYSAKLAPLVLLDLRNFLNFRPENRNARTFEFLFTDRTNGLREYLDSIGFPQTKIDVVTLAITKPNPTASLRNVSPKLIRIETFINQILKIKEPIICGVDKRKGTASVLVWDKVGKEHCLLTAGHVFKRGVGTKVDRARLKYFICPYIEPLGIISQHVEPHHKNASHETVGWDAAVIKLNHQFEPSGVVVSQAMRNFLRPEPVMVYGSKSGLIYRAAVQGAMTDVDKWKNCWMIAPSGVLTDGDSGSAVFTQLDSNLLGMYVACSGIEFPHIPLFHFVQDALTLEREWLIPQWNISLTKQGD